ncbi:MAG: hypothetical protein ACFFCS_26420, partial [Candidatus Hodarchaeota archaeon]
LLGSITKNHPADWIDLGSNRWGTVKGTFPGDVGFIMLGNENQNNTGIKLIQNMNDVDSDREFWYDLQDKRIVLYCTQNPANAYPNIEIAYSEDHHGHVISASGINDVIVDSIALKYFNAHGMSLSSVRGITVRNCDITFGGGQIQYDEVRFGNGIEFWGSAQDCLVEHCKIGEIYDAAVTNQGNGFNSEINITYRNNLLWNSEYLYEYWNGPENSTTKDIYFLNNTCLKAGFGWAHDQRPDPSGRSLCFYQNLATIQNFNIQGNIFIESTLSCFWLSSTWGDLGELDVNFNSYYQATGNLINYQGSLYTMAQFSLYQGEKGQDINSTTPSLTSIKDEARNISRPEDLTFLNSILDTI